MINGKPLQSVLEQYLLQYVTDGNPHVLVCDNLGIWNSRTVTLILNSLGLQVKEIKLDIHSRVINFYWYTVNLIVVRQFPLHAVKFGVWCAMNATIFTLLGLSLCQGPHNTYSDNTCFFFSATQCNSSHSKKKKIYGL